MFEKLKMLSARLDELEMRLSAPDLYDDPARAARLLRERNELEPIVEAYRAYERAQQQLADATEMLSDPDMKELAQEELQQAKSDIARLEGELKLLLLPKDPNDEKNIYVEIRGGAGGEESALFAADLYRMYTMYADRRGWQTEVMSRSETELGGYKEIVFRVAGDRVYSRLKFESGVHRVQRVPETESQGRVHTSTTTVAVLPEAEELDFYIDPKDLRIDTFRASGAGGQHINKTSQPAAQTALLGFLGRAGKSGRGVQLVGSLIEQLAAVREDEHAVALPHPVLGNLRKNDSLSAAGGNRKQGAVVTLLPAVLDRFTRRLLIRSQFHIRMLPA